MIAFGPLLVAGAAAVQIGFIEPIYLLAGIPTGLLTVAIVWINQFPDIKGDAASNKRTLVVRLGLDRSRWAYVMMVTLTYISITTLVALLILPLGALAGLITIPLAFYFIRKLFADYKSRAIKDSMAGTIYIHFLTGLLMVIGTWLTL
jgi:1,4-dihydroxy-2-naphthoate octaprenyltransferase